ncbi:MAG: ATP phosphoribosyltransferase [Chloroflexota bacterium]|nr:ATP phosphoribosyltransferase [Chloroflexota bacterium]
MAQSHGRRMRLAMQRQGRLTEGTLALLRGIGLQFESYQQRLLTPCRNFPLDILYGRDDDIPEYVADGIVDLGIVGRNVIAEKGANVEELTSLGFGYCALVVAVPDESEVEDPSQLDGCRVATSYPRSAQEYFDRLGVRVELVELSGSVEVAPALGIASGIVDLSATGSTLVINDLRPIGTVLESEAVLIAGDRGSRCGDVQEHIDRLLMRIGSLLAGRQYKYIMMNVPRDALPAIREITPGLKSPTVVPLASPEWAAVHTVIREDEFWEVIERLRAAGASEILVNPIEKLLL